MSKYYIALDSLIIAAELAATGKHQESAQFLIGATKRPEYKEMIQAMTEQQKQAREQEEEQGQGEEQARLSMALARVLGSNGENADVYPDQYQWQDDQQKDEQDKVNEGSVQTSGEQQQNQEQQQQQDQQGQQSEQASDDDLNLGIDLDEQEEETMEGDEQEHQQASTPVEAALARIEQSGTRVTVRASESTETASLADRQARLARNKNARA